ncbi:phasin family protein [Phaeobacter sp. B1627]|uniref:phasin family protein n=1 Tax=Phaeobacter sp. B1627 TaxID=2583809 RepID=UPI00159EEEF7|nr:phasin family protein [Phaeobacter sp. B1627]
MPKTKETAEEAGIESIASFGTDWFEAMAEIGSEMLNFTAERIKQDLETQHELLSAKGIADIQRIQLQFFQKAINDYAAETAKLLEMSKSRPPNHSSVPL